MQETQEPLEVVMLRLPPVMKAHLQRMAKLNRRSLNMELRLLLEQHVPDPLVAQEIER